MSADFDETKHPRGQPGNAGRFRRRLLPMPPLVNRRRGGPVGFSASLEELARDAVAKPEKCPLCREYVVIVTPRPGSDPVEWCGCGNSLRNDLGLPLVWEIVNEIVRQGRLPVPDCHYCGVRLECRDPSVHVHGLHGSECHAFRHVVEECESRPDAVRRAISRSLGDSGTYGPGPSPQADTSSCEVPGPATSTTPAIRGSGEPQEEGPAVTDPPPRERRRARNAATAAASAVLLAGSTVPGWSSILEVRLAMLVATAALLVQAPHILREARRNWREGTELKLQGQQTRAESELRSELNRHVSRLVADATAAKDTIKGFDEAIEQSDQRDPVRDKMARATRRALVEEARARVKVASAATARAQASDALPYQERVEAIAELIGELEATA